MRSVPNNTVVSYFNGVRIKEPSVFSFSRKKSPYLVEIGEEDDFLDVPEEFSSTERYVASTGHKVNHKKESNGRFEECLHPRFGWIHCFISNRVRKESEFLPKHMTNVASWVSITSS